MLKSLWTIHPPLIRQVVALAYTALLTIVLLQSSSYPVVGPAAPPGEPDLGREIILTSGHIIGFALLVWVWWWALRATSKPTRALVLSVMIGLVLSIVTEMLQNLVPDRAASVFDLTVNVVVTLVTAYVVYIRSGRIFT